MKKIIIPLLCCGMLTGMVGCGGNTAPPPAKSPPTTVLKTIITKMPTETTLPVTAVEATEKETVFIKNQEQAIEPTPIAPTPTVKTTEEVKSSEATNMSEEKFTSQTVEATPNTTTQHTESETKVTEPTKEITPESETPQFEFDVQYWISFAKEYAVSVGLILDSEAVSCWDNPIGAGAHCIYLERDIESRLNRYAKDDDITDVWIWAEPVGDDFYDIYIGYA